MSRSRLGVALVALLFLGCQEDGADGLVTPPAQVGPDDSTGLETDFEVPSTDGDQLTPVPTGVDGSACTSADECSGGSCLAGGEFPDGFCTAEGCAEDRDCGGGVCVAGAGLPGVDNTFCAPLCDDITSCRDGFDCVGGACQPPPPAADQVDGASCRTDAECRGGTCIAADDWQDGYCTTVGCEDFEDCASDGEDNRCLLQSQRGGDNFCVRICQASSECRIGYVCEGLSRELGYCAPSPYKPLDLDLGNSPLNITCTPAPEAQVAIEFNIAEDTSSYMVTPFSLDGRGLYPSHVALPDGKKTDLRGENEFQAIGAYLFGFINPTIIPATPDFTSQMQAGAHEYLIDIETDEVCHYLLEEQAPGTQLDVNVYLVGVPGLTAETAPSHESLQTVLTMFDEVYAQSDVQVGEIRYYDIAGEDGDRYSIVRSEADVAALASLSQNPGDTLDDVLSINVFFVDGMAFEDGGGAIGISSGLPGPAGLHGTAASGVVFTTEFMGTTFQERWGDDVDGDRYTGIVFAHEVGHYLGLFHTSEQYGQGFDPLGDTPQCSSNDMASCADLENLMFPFAGISHQTLTDDQAFVIQVNPLTRN